MPRAVGRVFGGCWDGVCVRVCFHFGPLRACSQALCFLEGSEGSSDVSDREKRMALLSER